MNDSANAIFESYSQYVASSVRNVKGTIPQSYHNIIKA